MIIIPCNQDELNALKQLLHRAVQHSGLEAAEAAVHWMHKIADAERRTAKGNGADHAQPAHENQ